MTGAAPACRPEAGHLDFEDGVAPKFFSPCSGFSDLGFCHFSSISSKSEATCEGSVQTRSKRSLSKLSNENIIRFYLAFILLASLEQCYTVMHCHSVLPKLP